jgi:hypothetical protein
MNGDPDAPPDVRAQIELTRANPSNSFLVPILPIGRSQWLRTSVEDRSAPFRLYPVIPRKLRYPDDFPPAKSVAILPTGNFLGDLSSPPHLIVRGDGGRGDTLAVDSLVRIESLILSVATRTTIDTAAMRPKWEKTVRERFRELPPESVQDLVGTWMPYRSVPTKRAFRKDEHIGIVVLTSAGDTLAADSVTLATQTSDVILTRRPN